MKSQWQTILHDASLNPDLDNTNEIPSPIEQNSRNAPGDERDGGSVISKIQDRKYRIGKRFVILNFDYKKRTSLGQTEMLISLKEARAIKSFPHSATTKAHQSSRRRFQ